MAVTETRTFDNDDLLPRVPVPTLADSCARLLEWCAPLLTAEELAETRRAVEEFQAPGSPAHELQAELERYDKQDGVHSWLDTFWPYRYLGRRDRIALNANFFFLFGDSPLGQLPRAAALITSAVNYKLRLDAERIPPIVQRGQPLSMAQNRFLFATTRIPGAEQDTVRAPYSDAEPGPATARHVVVFRAGRPFLLDVLAPDGRPYSGAAVADGLAEIVRRADELGRAEAPVGHLTTTARAEWAATRQALLDRDQHNAAALEAVETALFCVCLDDAAPADTQRACDLLLHGDSGNRWFDKAVSFVVFADGTAGINVEHCELDGTTILAFVDDLLAGTPEQRPTAAETPAAAPVEFALDAELAATARKAGAAFADYAAATATQCVAFDDFGANDAKRLGMSPDAFVQMAYQLAHRRAKGVTGATYESIATRQFRRGRTEAMRVVTPEAVAFVAAMTDPAADAESRRAAFRAAAAKHVARAKECQAGDAPEQHLWELQLIQRRRGAGEPLALYDSPGWRIMRDDYLSTSSAPSTHIQFFGFGSTSPQCIGVAYVLLPDRLNVYLSTPRRVADEMHRFAAELRTAIAELTELLTA